MRKTFAILALAALTAMAAIGFGPAAGAQAGTGTVTVIHGVPGVDVDVYVNGDLTLEDFKPETVTKPLELPAGDYTKPTSGPETRPAPFLTQHSHRYRYVARLSALMPTRLSSVQPVRSCSRFSMRGLCSIAR